VTILLRESIRRKFIDRISLPAPLQHLPLVSVRILLIEDDSSLSFFLVRALRRAGYEVVTEYRGDTGLQRALTDRFDLIILDWYLPGSTGLEVLKALRANMIDTRTMMLSGSGDDIRDEALQAGIDSFLAKPCGLDTLIEAVGNTLRAPRVLAGRSIALEE
jgi:DNA-binding response OmpR family regulator